MYQSVHPSEYTRVVGLQRMTHFTTRSPTTERPISGRPCYVYPVESRCQVSRHDTSDSHAILPTAECGCMIFAPFLSDPGYCRLDTFSLHLPLIFLTGIFLLHVPFCPVSNSPRIRRPCNSNNLRFIYPLIHHLPRCRQLPSTPSCVSERTNRRVTMGNPRQNVPRDSPGQWTGTKPQARRMAQVHTAWYFQVETTSRFRHIESTIRLYSSSGRYVGVNTHIFRQGRRRLTTLEKVTPIKPPRRHNLNQTYSSSWVLPWCPRATAQYCCGK